ncbi:hypothetical protein [Paraburkholderia sp. CI3]|uniref:hypothetical protein n=1 Tax=Paraburkholderia sp. CI3 TaxID=2991060 RepID=UPI003D2086E9
MSQTITITESNELIPYWTSKGLGRDNIAAITSADILLVPIEQYRNEVEFVFHQGTPRLFQFLREAAAAYNVEICIDDDQYLELALHGAAHRLGTMLVTYVAGPLLVGLLTNYLYDELRAKPQDTVEASIVVQDHECRGFSFHFDGNASDFHLLSDAVGELSKKCMDHQQHTHHAPRTKND